jgi:hypothetical protein
MRSNVLFIGVRARNYVTMKRHRCGGATKNSARDQGPSHSSVDLMRIFFGLWLFAFLACPQTKAAEQLPIIDAHSQFDEKVSPAEVMSTLREAGVSRVLLATRGQTSEESLLAMSLAQPGCVIPMVRTKGQSYAENKPGYYRQLSKQLEQPGYGAMAEVILAHAQKGKRAEQVYLPMNAPQVEAALKGARARNWPVILHYEMRWIAKDLGTAELQKRMEELESILRTHGDQPIGLIHMAQMDLSQVSDLLQRHKNLFFLLSHSNPLTTDDSKQPWTNVFQGSSIATEWAALIQTYPDRFVLAIDNVWPEHWTKLYSDQIKLWRSALLELGRTSAEAVAYRNALRIYGLPSLDAGHCPD